MISPAMHLLALHDQGTGRSAGTLSGFAYSLARGEETRICQRAYLGFILQMVNSWRRILFSECPTLLITCTGSCRTATVYSTVTLFARFLG